MRIDVLDHGYVELVEAWGTGHDGRVTGQDSDPDYEVGIIEAARQSTQGAARGWATDRKLLKHLHDNKHATPFEFAGMVLEIRAPIFVFREWHRHRTQSYNEASARYAPVLFPDYTPTVDRLMTPTEGPNKQASREEGSPPLTPEYAVAIEAEMQEVGEYLDACYQRWLSVGVPKELARVRMPVGHYSQMRASTSLRNWLSFLTLRDAPNAQWEIRQYAKAVGKCVAARFPETWALYSPLDGRANET